MKHGALDAAYYIDLIFFSGFVRGKILPHGEMPWQIFFGDPILTKFEIRWRGKVIWLFFAVF
jgi:hypothetical protein